MKLFKRTAKEADSPLNSATTAKQPTGNALGPLLPGLLAAALGIGAGTALLWFAQSSDGQARQGEERPRAAGAP